MTAIMSSNRSADSQSASDWSVFLAPTPGKVNASTPVIEKVTLSRPSLATRDEWAERAVIMAAPQVAYLTAYMRILRRPST